MLAVGPRPIAAPLCVDAVPDWDVERGCVLAHDTVIAKGRCVATWLFKSTALVELIPAEKP
jgi:hypothetical protein